MPLYSPAAGAEKAGGSLPGSLLRPGQGVAVVLRGFRGPPGEKVADVCAAPGGKSLTIAQYMENRGRLLSGDVHEHKCRAMRQRFREASVTISEVVQRDASAPCKDDERDAFDRVLCDVPCSGLGVIRRKPEIRYRPLEDLNSLPPLQYQILEQSAQLVRSGGVLQYSTCTLNPAENEAVTERFFEHSSGV